MMTLMPASRATVASPTGIAPYADGRRIHYRAAARLSKQPRLLDSDANVRKQQVRQTGIVVVRDPSAVFQRDLLARPRVIGVVRRLPEHEAEVYQQVLMRRCRPQIVGGDDAQHGLDFAGRRCRHGNLLFADGRGFQERRLGAIAPLSPTSSLLSLNLPAGIRRSRRRTPG